MTLFGFRHLAVDVGLISLGAGLSACRSVVGASQSLALPLCGRALAFVRAPLSLVRQPLTIIRDSIALIGDPISSTGQPFASSDLVLTPSNRPLALIDRVGLTFRLIVGVGAILGGHSSP